MLSVTLILTGCASAAKKSSVVAIDKVIMSGDWPSYSSIQDLIDKCDAVIIGTVEAVNEEGKSPLKLEINEDTSAEEKERLHETVKSYEPVTVSNIKVDKVLKGQLTMGTTIYVNQLGGIDHGVNYKDERTVYLNAGERYILFLSKTDTLDTYSTINPHQGQICIANGKTKKLVGNNLFNDNISEEEIAKLIEENMKK
jgi:hypothetical protein